MNNFKLKLLKLIKTLKQFFTNHVLSADTKMWRFIKPRWMCRVIKLLGTLVWAAFPFFCFIIIEYINFLNPYFDPATGEDLAQLTKMFTSRVSVIVFDLIILYGISVMLVLLFKRLWISCAILGGVSFALTVSSFLKYQARGEYLYPWDLQQAGNLGTLTEYINTTIPVEIVHIALILFCATLFVLLTRANLPIRWYVRIPPVLLATVVLFGLYSDPTRARQLVSSYGMNFFDAANQESNYSANGFIGAFSINVLSSSVTEPDGYSKKAIDGIIGDYKYEEAADSFKSPNVILVLQESFWDVTQLPNCTFSTDPLANYKEITSRDGVYSGSFATTTLGGGTVNPEFETLTGLLSSVFPKGAIPYQYIYDYTESYPSLFSTMGYKTMSVHPYYATFYMREAKYPLLGFDETWFYDELTTELAHIPIKWRGKSVSDYTFFDYIEYFMEKTEEPLFLFGITMESHQPYTNKFAPEEYEITVESPYLDEVTLNLVNQYTQCIYDSDRAIGAFVDYVDSCKEDTILILYGDHAPSLGPDFAAYRQTGLVASEGLITKEQRPYVYTTPFMIYANFELEETTMLSDDPTENSVAPYHLMNTALELIGAPRTPLMQFLRDYYELIPNYSAPLKLELTDEMSRYHDALRMLSYDRSVGEKYSVSRKN